jgi:hypothetical protein
VEIPPTRITEKIQQVKQIARQTGKLPDSIPGFASSSICPEFRWTYRALEKGDVDITLEKIPSWFMQNRKDLPIQFQLKNLCSINP